MGEQVVVEEFVFNQNGNGYSGTRRVEPRGWTLPALRGFVAEKLDGVASVRTIVDSLHERSFISA